MTHSKSAGKNPDTERPYIGERHFCGAACLKLFFDDIIDKMGSQEQTLKMEQLKQ